MNIKIEHLALWCRDLETMKDFYIRFFQCESNQGYHNPKKGFRSYFLVFSSGARLELMHKEDHTKQPNPQSSGYAHLALSLGSKEMVDHKTIELTEAGYRLLDGPRTTGDGYYESLFLDPEGNRLEITV